MFGSIRACESVYGLGLATSPACVYVPPEETAHHHTQKPINHHMPIHATTRPVYCKTPLEAVSGIVQSGHRVVIQGASVNTRTHYTGCLILPVESTYPKNHTLTKCIGHFFIYPGRSDPPKKRVYQRMLRPFICLSIYLHPKKQARSPHPST
jgi:hypothetical protein